jgi:S-adenosylmethionine/arginine decarboxylase-like enzyme
MRMMKPWGMIVLLDLFDCDPHLVCSYHDIERFPKMLCAKIDMSAFRDTMIYRFGEGSLEGYSAFQFIETSSITLHADETENRVFVDVFSCKDFDPIITSEFSKNFFKAKSITSKVVKRGGLDWAEKPPFSSRGFGG